MALRASVTAGSSSLNCPAARSLAKSDSPPPLAAAPEPPSAGGGAAAKGELATAGEGSVDAGFLAPHSAHQARSAEKTSAPQLHFHSGSRLSLPPFLALAK
eukprot:40835-Alexandrium_andersonii.AAC.1